MKLDSVRAIANAVLYEGYILYPYRPSSIKNRQRWTIRRRLSEGVRSAGRRLAHGDASSLAGRRAGGVQRPFSIPAGHDARGRTAGDADARASGRGRAGADARSELQCRRSGVAGLGGGDRTGDRLRAAAAGRYPRGSNCLAVPLRRRGAKLNRCAPRTAASPPFSYARLKRSKAWSKRRRRCCCRMCGS